MTDHLPECDRNLGSLVCICKQLRACEQRAYRAGYADAHLTDSEEQVRLFEAGVQAARDAVAALPWKSDETDFSLGRADGLGKALAAIDALGGSDADR